MGESLALEGIKILDFGRTAPVSFFTMLLGDLGAEVIMIEAPPSAGKREAGFRHTLAGGLERRYRRYRIANRNKRSIGLNLKSEKARDVFYELAKSADVIVEGFRPGVTERLGIDYQTICKLNPGIVYCSISGYGQDGPYRDLPGHDINFISVSGALDLIGSRNGKPVIPLNLVGEFSGGMHAAVGVLAALMVREKTGKGQYIDISITDSVLSVLTNRISDYFEHGKDQKRGETSLGGAYPYYNIYETKDGKYIAIGCVEEWLWEVFCREIGREDYIPFHFELDHLHKPVDGEKWAEISASLEQIFLTRTSNEWFEILAKKDIPVSKVNTLGEALMDAQICHRDMVVDVDDTIEGKIRQNGIAIKLSDTPGRIRQLPPLLGEHTDDILRELGYNQQTIDELRQGAIIS